MSGLACNNAKKSRRIWKGYVKVYIWNISLYSSKIWTMARRHRERLVTFEMWCSRRSVRNGAGRERLTESNGNTQRKDVWSLIQNDSVPRNIMKGEDLDEATYPYQKFKIRALNRDGPAPNFEEIKRILHNGLTSLPSCWALHLLILSVPEMKSFWTSTIRNTLTGRTICTKPRGY